MKRKIVSWNNGSKRNKKDIFLTIFLFWNFLESCLLLLKFREIVKKVDWINFGLFYAYLNVKIVAYKEKG